eukprot:3412156-Amphidinium_carterae.2
MAYDNGLLEVHLHVGLSKTFVHLPVSIAKVPCKTRSGSHQDHVIDIFPKGNMSSRTLQSFKQESMQEVYCMTTPWRHAMRGGNRLTHSSLQQHTTPPGIHVQRSIKGIGGVSTLQSKLL